MVRHLSHFRQNRALTDDPMFGGGGVGGGSSKPRFGTPSREQTNKKKKMRTREELSVAPPQCVWLAIMRYKTSKPDIETGARRLTATLHDS